MDFKDIKQHVKELMTAMGRSGIKRLAIKHKDLEVELERGEVGGDIATVEVPAQVPLSRTLPSAVQSPQSEHSHSSGHESHGQAITSPMVGTFYTASAPENPPLVKTGDTVGKDDVVCIIEAMKVMNEIKAGVAGTIVEVLVNNGDPVEFGTVLFRVR